MLARLRQIGERVASHARRSMSTSTRAAGPSADGAKYPHADSGRLRAGITYAVENQGDGKLVARIGTNVEYGYPIHEGIDNKGNKTYEGRPFLKSAI